MTDSTRQTQTPTTAVLAAYYAMLLAFLLASFFPEYRVWGINLWAYFPTFVPLVLFGVGAVIPFAIRWIPGREQISKENRKYVWLVLGLTLLFGLAFYFLRARTHFLGDGYTVLSLLAQENPLVKTRELGEALAHIWMKSGVGGGGRNAALLSFQIISISSGALFLFVTAAASRRLFERTAERLLFWLGLASGGYMLLFFGYVENYSLLVLAVATYALTGLVVARGILNRWLILIPLAFAIFFHVIAATLIPSAVYLLLANSRAGDFTARQSRAAKIAFTLAALAVAIWVFHHFYTTEYFFRFAFVPLFENRFTVEGYTLFSINHLADYANLLLLLLPGLPIVIAVLRLTPIKKTLKRREYRFLLILMASTLGAVFVLDPKLGMPRDWDLFSFAGVPLAIFGFYYLLDSRLTGRHNVKAASLAIALSVLSLLPRAVGQAIPETSLAHFNSYLELDRVRTRNAGILLVDYYYDRNDTVAAENSRAAWHDRRIDEPLVLQANRLLDAGHVIDAAAFYRRALSVNPVSPIAYTNLGECYLRLGQLDSARTMLEIADGLNPNNAITINNLGLIQFKRGSYREAEHLWLKAASLDTGFVQPRSFLIKLYRTTRDRQKYVEFLTRTGLRDDAPLYIIQWLADYYLQRGRYDDAARAYARALEKGLDSAYIDSLQERFPQLRQFLNLHPIPFDKSL